MWASAGAGINSRRERGGRGGSPVHEVSSSSIGSDMGVMDDDSGIGRLCRLVRPYQQRTLLPVVSPIAIGRRYKGSPTAKDRDDYHNGMERASSPTTPVVVRGGAASGFAGYAGQSLQAADGRELGRVPDRRSSSMCSMREGRGESSSSAKRGGAASPFGKKPTHKYSPTPIDGLQQKQRTHGSSGRENFMQSWQVSEIV